MYTVEGSWNIQFQLWTSGDRGVNLKDDKDSKQQIYTRKKIDSWSIETTLIHSNVLMNKDLWKDVK